jgi:hypothetical protein
LESTTGIRAGDGLEVPSEALEEEVAAISMVIFQAVLYLQCKALAIYSVRANVKD